VTSYLDGEPTAKGHKIEEGGEGFEVKQPMGHKIEKGG
jgi:hypothetical protein